MTHQTMPQRTRGTGSIYRRPDGMWIGRVSLPSEPGDRRRRKVMGMRFCDMLRKFSDVLTEYPPPPAAPSRDARLEHKTPLCRGGSDSIDNLAVACELCNRRKGRMTADEYMAVLHG